MNGNGTTVKEMIEFLKTMPEDALIYYVETIDGEAQDIYFAVLNVWKQDGCVMIN